MQNDHKKRNLFDRLIDQFSTSELKTRVWLVIVLGFVLCGIAVFGGWWLFTHNFFIADKPGYESVEFFKLLFRGLK